LLVIPVGNEDRGAHAMAQDVPAAGTMRSESVESVVDLPLQAGSDTEPASVSREVDPCQTEVELCPHEGLSSFLRIGLREEEVELGVNESLFVCGGSGVGHACSEW
jgi:hypothetical protein